MSKVCDPDVFCDGCGERNPTCYCNSDQPRPFPILRLRKLKYKGKDND